MIQDPELAAMLDRLRLEVLATKKRLDSALDALRTCRAALENPAFTPDTVWVDPTTTMADFLDFTLDPGPEARGETPLFPEVLQCL